jgi:SprT protein
MQEQIIDNVEGCFITAEKFYNRKFDRPTAIIFKRSGTTAGRCTMAHNFSRRELMFQLDLAEHNPEDYKNTCAHEVAHYIQFMVYGFKVAAHGREWQYIMRYVYNLNPDRLHNYDTSVTKVKRQTRHTYTCSCRKYELSSTMHNRIQTALNDFASGKTRAITYARKCGSCGVRLKLEKVGDANQQKLDLLLKRLDAMLKAKKAQQAKEIAQ